MKKRLKGSHFEVNYQISKFFKSKLDGINLKKLSSQRVQKILDLLKQYPFILQELEGRSEGFGVGLDEFLYLTSYEVEKLEEEKCSDILAVNGDKRFIIHNEDGRDEVEFFICEYEDKNVLDLACYETLHGSTFSATKDIMFSINFIYNMRYNLDNDLPTWIFTRILLSCDDIDKVMEVLNKYSIWGSVSINLLDVKENKLYSIEKSLKEFSIIEIESVYFHTNTLIHDEMQKYNFLPDNINTSHARYDKIKELLALKKFSYEEIMLYNNGNDYDSVRMLGENKNHSKTQATIRFDNKKIEVLGNRKETIFIKNLL